MGIGPLNRRSKDSQALLDDSVEPRAIHLDTPTQARKALAENWSGHEVQLPEERDHRRARRTLHTRRRRVDASAHDRPEEGRTEAAMKVDNTLIVAAAPSR